MVNCGARMYGDHLVVFKRQVVARLLQVRHLKEETRQQALPDEGVVLRVRHRPALELESLLHIDVQELVSDVIGLSQASVVDEVVVAPVLAFVL